MSKQSLEVLLPENIKTICCYGASVTEQKTGYAHILKELYQDSKNIIQQGYGGRYLNDAAMVHIDDAIAVKPDLVILDWFNTDFVEDYAGSFVFMDTLIRRFSQAGIALMGLFTPRNPFDKPRHQMFADCKLMFAEFDIPYLDLCELYPQLISPKRVVNSTLRDVVHTTDQGSLDFAKHIKDFVDNHHQGFIVPTWIPPETAYCDISRLGFEHTIYEHIHFRGFGKIIGFDMQVGRYTGKVILTDADGVVSDRVVWDRWCHYERPHIELVDIDVEESLEITITEDEFDRSLCKRQVQWESPRKLVLKRFYYTGDVEIVSFA